MAWSSMSVKHPAQRSTIQTLASAVLCVSVTGKMHNETKEEFLREVSKTDMG